MSFLNLLFEGKIEAFVVNKVVLVQVARWNKRIEIINERLFGVFSIYFVVRINLFKQYFLLTCGYGPDKYNCLRLSI